MKTKVINLYGGPGTGKSTNAARLFAALKDEGREVELVTEYAKDLVWEERHKTFDDQVYIFAKQYHRIQRLIGKVEFIVTDSPILLSTIYDPDSSVNLCNLVLECYEKCDNVNYFLTRIKEYRENGRMQTFEEAKEIDQRILNMLNDFDISYNVIEGSAWGINRIIKRINNEL